VPPSPHHDSKQSVSVVVAADESYCIPLAVTVASMLESLAADARVDVFVLDNGITQASKERLQQSWQDGRATIRWIRVDASLFGDFPIAGHISSTAYVRLMLQRLLPESLDRIIYLDSDLLVLDDIAALWREPWEGNECIAVQDVACPWMDSQHVLPNFRRVRSRLAAARPVPNYSQLGFSPHDPYFNSGVMVIDLAAWRRRDVAARFLACLERNRQYVTFWDQYLLNVEMHGRWRQLPLEWNVGTHLFRWSLSGAGGFDRQTLRRITSRPKIVHFTTADKPWLIDNMHPFRGHFFAVVDRTAWRGWRPGTPFARLSSLTFRAARSAAVRASRLASSCRRLFHTATGGRRAEP